MSPAARSWLEQSRNALITAAVTVLVQLSLFWLSVRDDLHDMQHDVRELKCGMAIITKAPMVPDGCHPAPLGTR